jgi:hypothetical protein
MTLAQVSDWRKPSTSSSSSSSGSSNTSTPNRTTDPTPSISSWRNEPQRQTTPVYTPPKRPVYQPFYYGPNYGRWYNWGAPYMGFDYWTPGFYYNNWGYREPARIYYYNDGRRDTIRGRKTHFSLGLQTPVFKNEFGGWLSVGDRTYFIIEFLGSTDKDYSDYFPNKTIWNYYNDRMVVNGQSYTINQLFPLQKDFERNNIIYAGLGKKVKRIGVHLMFGINNQTLRYRYKDDIGYISFPKSNKKLLTGKFGIMKDWGPFTGKLDIDPITGRVIVGAGLNF